MSGRIRPRNRRAQIAAVAAEAFDAYGYHGVGMDDIAATLGISGPALYRHFPGKYALFLSSVESLVGALDEATDLPGEPGEAPRRRLERVLYAVVETSLTHRRSGGLYRWEARLLHDDDRRRVVDTVRVVIDRIAAPVRSMRPDMPESDVRLRTTAALSILGSVTGHRTPLARHRIPPLLVGGCLAVIASPPSSAGRTVSDAAAATNGVADTNGVAETSTGAVGAARTPPHSRAASTGTPYRPGPARHEALLAESLRLFARRGYHEASIEEIAAAAGLTASGLYRHFDGKPALLDAAFRRVTESIGGAQDEVIAAASGPAEALRGLTRLYVRRALRHPDQLTVYFAEVANLPPGRRRTISAIQRKSADRWASLLVQVRPELTRGEARFLVQAVFALILDVGRVVHFRSDPQTRAQMEAMIGALLFSDDAEPAAARAPHDPPGAADVPAGGA